MANHEMGTMLVWTKAAIGLEVGLPRMDWKEQVCVWQLSRSLLVKSAFEAPVLERKLLYISDMKG